MLIPINDDIDVQRIDTKEASHIILDAIDVLCDADYIEYMKRNVKHNVFQQTSDMREATRQGDQFAGLMRRCGSAIQSNNYMYLTEDVCDMIAETQTSLHSWTIEDLHIEPGVTGTILFAKPTFQDNLGADAQYSGKTHTDVVGLHWMYHDNMPLLKDNGVEETNALWVGIITDTTPVDAVPGHKVYAHGSNEFAYEITDDGSLTPVWDHSDTGAYNNAVIDYFAATMMLVQQREIIAPLNSYRPTVKRGKRRDPVLVPTGDITREPMKISTVSLSETVRNAYAANSSSTGQKPTKSWWVKGHWRRQAYGPQRSLRKLIYIHPHISGNINAPLDDRKTMTKVVP